MKTPYGQECQFYYADYFRGRNVQECRLLQANPATEAWKPALCQTCPVPEILRANDCPHLVLRARVGTIWWGLVRRVQVEAACREYQVLVPQPHIGCGHCHTLSQTFAPWPK